MLRNQILSFCFEINEKLQFLYFTWRDDRALDEMKSSTDAYRNGSLEECKKPCTSSIAWLPRDMNDDEGEETLYEPELSCCDNVWLPSITFINNFDVPSVQRYSIVINKRDIDEGIDVVYWVEFQATYFTPMNFRLFPYDSQELVSIFNCPGRGVGNLIPSATSTRFWLKTGGEDTTSGWRVDSLNITTAKDSTQEVVRVAFPLINFAAALH